MLGALVANLLVKNTKNQNLVAHSADQHERDISHADKRYLLTHAQKLQMQFVHQLTLKKKLQLRNYMWKEKSVFSVARMMFSSFLTFPLSFGD